ncbi:Xaa-Pro peptidase family protein [Aeromicrobium sp.]|uniref:M24 family metallopeptidase n=1 Tax=Aeromicrobium sp. TaxID=1871063 RepID=UPI0030C5DF59
MTTYGRLDRLGEELLDRSLEGLFVTTLVNVRYLTGFTGSNGAVYVSAGGHAVFVTDGRYRDQAAVEVPDLEHVISRDLLGEMARRASGADLGIESHTLSVDALARLTEHLPSTRLQSAGRVVEGLRETKDAVEVDALRRACEISTVALGQLLEGPLVGRTEREVARDLENRMLDLGAEAIAFDTILAAGDNSAIPHHSPTDRLLVTGDLVKADFGARVDGYHADCTRTFVLGRADDWQREIHTAVRQSQEAGVDALRAGSAVADSYGAATAALETSGWLHAFTTGLGHGVGLEIHEDPFIGPSQTGKLASRTVLTMEPGIYVPGRGGVRIEDTVLVNPGAPEVLTTMTKDLLEIG